MIISKKHFFLYGLSFLFLTACADKTKNDTANIKTVPVYKITLKDTVVSNRFVADVHAKNNVEIHVRIPGILDKVFVSEGQKVNKGQVLFKISDAELQIQLIKADAVYKSMLADLRIASVELNQAQTLFTKKVIASQELELSKAKHDAATAKVAHAAAEKKSINQQISFTTIRAPFDGTIDRIPFKEGSLVENGSLLTTLSQLDDVYAYFSIPENTYFQMMADNSLKTKGDIQLVLPNGVVYSKKGELKTADGEIDRQTGSIQYKAKFHNPEGFIKHGTSGSLIISEPRTNVVLIPQKAVFSIQDKQFVFVVNKEGIVKMTNISIANTLDDAYILNKGLKQNDLIVQEGTQSLRDGDKINIKQMQSASL
ncbi:MULTISPECIES: efflux RND transporter periplasmic adaptor subunit [unclassified Flavobacterium]|uniref:efflux RND transporter periplasmic adaptor subunit n=1 Tax=unclassified Flavobacterium TaxID=196869 RepID=UPI000F0C8DD8|nr:MULTISPECIES: efflux RND transporter periplasmic adaptor subunit [unclassified Flavobacterium]AYN03779.1 efflux RND transporter periplasmic adaptor subunit [Flavobacterium sp. 140616W15]MCD0476668.1 efflux RND transporter periplasmic adaptor subunit [Flavobacterium sp. EDS]